MELRAHAPVAGTDVEGAAELTGDERLHDRQAEPLAGVEVEAVGETHAVVDDVHVHLAVSPRDAYIGQDTQLVFSLHQNATNGLYEFSTNDIALPGDCTTGNQVIVYSSYDGGYSLWLQAPLT